MRLLLDTHSFLWWLAGDLGLSQKARVAIREDATEVYVSAASAWEIATKHRLGKLPHAHEAATNLERCLNDQSFMPLPITIRHGHAAGALPGPHRDPFDRMLIAQAMIENLVLVSNERVFDAYGVKRLW